MKMTLSRNMLAASLLLTVFLLTFAPTAGAAASGNGDRWDVDGSLYFWYASVGGNTALSTGVDVDADDLVSNLDFAFMGTVDARKGDWSFLTDLIYLSVSEDQQSIITMPVVGSVPTTTRVDLEGWVVNLSGAYNVFEEGQTRFDVLAGLRYFWMDAKLNFTAGAISLSPSDSGDVFDAVIGIKGRLGLSDKWYLPYYFDIGAGESDLTWQAYAGVGYEFRNLDVEVAYRHIDWDLDDSPVLDDVNFDGPFAGVNFRF